jgi:hypothetical protein
MRTRFHTISGGGYAHLLYHKFGRERVERELDDFLTLNFFPRFGGGIGMTRMMRALGSPATITASPQTFATTFSSST